jgi:outer membrane protein assembly factor BamB
MRTATRIAGAGHYTGTFSAAELFAALYNGRLYVPISSWEEFSAASLDYPCCTSRGSVAAFDASTGRQVWKTYVIPEDPQPVRKNTKGVQLWAPAGASVWNAPTVDAKRHAIYFGTGDATTAPAAKTSDAVMALDMDTGKVRWAYQAFADDSFLVGCDGPDKSDNCPVVQGPDLDIPASPILRTLKNGQRVLLVATKPGDLIALDPDRGGAVIWKRHIGNQPNTDTKAGASRTGNAGTPTFFTYVYMGSSYGVRESPVQAADPDTPAGIIVERMGTRRGEAS